MIDVHACTLSNNHLSYVHDFVDRYAQTLSIRVLKV